ncbi:MAG TPA: hypothetical protein VIL99_14610 [Ignavibacteria bacterium]
MAKEKKKSAKQEVVNYDEKPLFNYGLLAVFFIFLIFFTTFKITGDDDVFWHLATGRYIIETGSVPATDVFGFITQGQKWMPFEWGWDILTYSVYNIAGYIGLSILRTLLLIIVFSVFLLILRKFKVNYNLVILALITLLFSIIDRLTPRPHLMSYVFFALTLYILIQYRYFKRDNYKILFFLPLIFLFWANTHMGIIAGILLLGVYVSSELISYFSSNSSKNTEIRNLNKPEIVRLLMIFIACLLVMLINPNGIATYIYAYDHTKMKMLETVNEWVSPFSEKYTDSFVSYLYKGFLFSGILVLYYAFKKKDLFLGLLYIVFAVYSVRAMRFTVDYILVMFCFTIISIDYLSGKVNSRKLKKYFSINPVPKLIISAALILLIFPVKDDSLYLKFLKYYRVTGFGINSDFIPTQMFSFIKENKINEIGERPFNHFGTGGFLIWNFPASKNFIDSRNLNDSIFFEYNTIIGKKPGFEKKFKDYNFDYVIYLAPDLIRMPEEMEQTIISYLSKNSNDWKLVFWDDKSFLWVKNLPKFKDLIDKYEYKYMTPYNYAYNKPVLEKGINEDLPTLKKEIDRKMAEDPNGIVISSAMKIYGNRIK